MDFKFDNNIEKVRNLNVRANDVSASRKEGKRGTDTFVLRCEYE